MTEGSAELPSGRQYEIAHGDHRAVAVEVGGGLRTYSHRDFDVLDGYPREAVCSGARGQPLMPWPNRVSEGRYVFDGVEHRLALTEPERRTAIHGLLRWSSWQAVEHAEDRVVMGALVHPQPGYPFALEARVAYSLGPEGLRVSLTGRNAGAQRLPFAAGQHPYIRVSEAAIDGAELECPAQVRLVADGRGIPTGERVAVAGEYDLRRPQVLGPRILDTAFTELERDAGGMARVLMRGPEREVTLWMDAGFPYLMLFTGDTLPPEERRRGLAVEPMTAPPNALQSGEDLCILRPGESVTVSWGISVCARG